MIRIDEIYQNVFLPQAYHKPATGLHWFDPFGSTSIKDIVNLPPIEGIADHRIVFWDQEPLHLDIFCDFFDLFQTIYWPGPTSVVTSEKNSDNVKFVCDKYGLESAYYFFHAWAALDWYRGYDRSFLIKPWYQRQITKTFVCPNNIIGGKRIHRILLLRELQKNNLIANNLISFPKVCPYEKTPIEDICIKNHIEFEMQEIGLPLKLDDFDDYNFNSHRIDIWGAAEVTLLQVVTETVYSGTRSHLTEKTFKPIVMQQPFVLISCQGSLEYLRSYGFCTFGNFWDEDYDHANDDDRVAVVAKLLKDLDNLSLREKKQLQQHLAPVIEHNVKWFYSKEFENLLWKELCGMMRIFEKTSKPQ